jgi:hypothetical protein
MNGARAATNFLKTGNGAPAMKRNSILRLAMAAAMAGGMLTASGSAANAAAPGYKVRMVEGGVEDARAAVEKGESPEGDCSQVAMQGRSILDEYSDDANAVIVAKAALESCGYELPVTYFGARIEAVADQLAAAPGSPVPCNDFVSEFSVYFNVASGGPVDGADPEKRVKETLSERVKEVCPYAAMAGF